MRAVLRAVLRGRKSLLQFAIATPAYRFLSTKMLTESTALIKFDADSSPRSSAANLRPN